MARAVGEDEAIERARAFFDDGAELVYIAVEQGRIYVELQPPESRGVIIAARSTHDVERFLGDAKRWISAPKK